MIPSLKGVSKQKIDTNVVVQPLCTNVKCFAYCNDINCQFRHEFNQEDLDIPPNAPTNGELQFEVLQSISPSLYTAKLLNHYVFDEETGERKCTTSYCERSTEMMEYYSIKNNQTHPTTASVGELYGVKISSEDPKNSSITTTYLRAKFIKNAFRPGHVEMFGVDIGSTIFIPISELLILPEQFRIWEPQFVNVVLTNLIYLEDQQEYCPNALKAAKELTEGKKWHGKVLLSIRDTIWVNPMVQYEKDPVTGHTTLGCNLITELVYGTFVAYNDQHMMTILECIRKTDPSYPEFEHEMNLISDYENRFRNGEFHESGDPVKWNELPVSDLVKKLIYPVELQITSWINPWHVYGTICENETSKLILKDLENELSIEINRLGKNNKAKYSSRFANLMKKGSIVAVRTSNRHRWQRAKILQKYQSAGELENRFNLLLVDYGTLALGLKEFETVVPIRKLYVDALPFKMVCLQLSHIRPVGDQVTAWKQEEVNKFSRIVCRSNKVTVIAYQTIEGETDWNYYRSMAFSNWMEEELYEEIGLELAQEQGADASAPSYADFVFKRVVNCLIERDVREIKRLNGTRNI